VHARYVPSSGSLNVRAIRVWSKTYFETPQHPSVQTKTYFDIHATHIYPLSGGVARMDLRMKALCRLRISINDAPLANLENPKKQAN